MSKGFSAILRTWPEFDKVGENVKRQSGEVSGFGTGALVSVAHRPWQRSEAVRWIGIASKLMSVVKKILPWRTAPGAVVGFALIALLGVLACAQSAQPRIDLINITNGNRSVDIHWGTEVNRTYILQGSCGTNSVNCYSNGVAPGNWVNLRTISPSPMTNHYIYRDGLTNRTRFYRLTATP